MNNRANFACYGSGYVKIEKIQIATLKIDGLRRSKNIVYNAANFEIFAFQKKKFLKKKIRRRKNLKRVPSV